MPDYTIADMLKSSLTNEPATMKTMFSSLMTDKIRDNLEAKRDEVAANIYNDPEDEEVQDDETVDDDTEDDSFDDEVEDETEFEEPDLETDSEDDDENV